MERTHLRPELNRAAVSLNSVFRRLTTNTIGFLSAKHNWVFRCQNLTFFLRDNQPRRAQHQPPMTPARGCAIRHPCGHSFGARCADPAIESALLTSERPGAQVRLTDSRSLSLSRSRQSHAFSPFYLTQYGYKRRGLSVTTLRYKYATGQRPVYQARGQSLRSRASRLRLPSRLSVRQHTRERTDKLHTSERERFTSLSDLPE